MGDWLGTGRVADGTQNWVTYNQAKKFAINNKITSKDEWYNFKKENVLPNNIPADPRGVYSRKNQWKGWLDFFGKKKGIERNYLSYSEVKKYVRGLGIQNSIEWNNFVKMGNKPDNIPRGIDKVYKNEGWEGWKKFLGTENVKKKIKRFCSFQEARNYVRTLKLKNTKEWKEYCKSGRKPNNIPSSPENTYDDLWEGWIDFLGSKYLKPRNNKENILKFKIAKIKIKKIGVNTSREYRKIAYKKIKNLPSNPNIFYKDQWKGWADFLGKE